MTIDYNKLIIAINKLNGNRPEFIKFVPQSDGYTMALKSGEGYSFNFETLYDVAVLNGIKETDGNTVDENKLIDILAKYILNKLNSSSNKPFPEIISRF